MSEQEILTAIGEIVQEATGIPAARVVPDASFTGDLDVDSLSMVEIATMAEDRFSDLDSGRRPEQAQDRRRRRGLRRESRRPGVTDREVVVTGLGATTPLGGDMPSTWRGLLAGQSGAALLDDEWAADLPVRIAARPATEPSTALPPARLRSLDRSQQFALVAALEAWRDAGEPEVEPERLGAVVASGIGGLIDDPRAVRRAAHPRRATGVAVHRADDHAERRSRSGRARAQRSGRRALAGLGMRVRRGGGGRRAGHDPDGRADVVVCGGAEAVVHPLPLAAFAAMRALSPRHDDPQAASRPFDKQRDGFVLGEGAAILVLETREHADGARRDDVRRRSPAPAWPAMRTTSPHRIRTAPARRVR